MPKTAREKNVWEITVFCGNGGFATDSTQSTVFITLNLIILDLNLGTNSLMKEGGPTFDRFQKRPIAPY